MTPINKRLLVVDDEEAIRESLVLGLGDYGWEVTECATCSSAMDYDVPFDVYLIDLALPDEDGFELASNLGKRFGKVPIVLFSGFINGKLKEEAEAHNVSVVVKKPFKFEELDRVLRELVKTDRPN